MCEFDEPRTTKEEDEEAIWDAFNSGGTFSHNIVALRLGRFDEKWGQAEARAIYARLIAEGY